MPSGRDLTVKQREKLFLTWCECRSIRETARKCSVSAITVHKYMDLDHWWDRHEKVLKETQQKNDNKAVYNLTNELLAVDFFIKNHINQLIELIKRKKFKGSSREFRELVKTKKEILEVVEPEVPVDPERDEVAGLLEKFSREALIAVGEAAAAKLTRPDDKKKNGRTTTKS